MKPRTVKVQATCNEGTERCKALGELAFVTGEVSIGGRETQLCPQLCPKPCDLQLSLYSGRLQVVRSVERWTLPCQSSSGLWPTRLGRRGLGYSSCLKGVMSPN